MSRLTTSVLAAVALAALATAPVLASSGGGAPRVKTNVFIHAMDRVSDGAVIKGQLFSKRRACERGRRVRVFDFDRRRLATVRARDNGRFRYRVLDSDFDEYGGRIPPGEYEVRVERPRKIGAKKCKKSRYVFVSYRG